MENQAASSASRAGESLLDELQTTLQGEIPISAQMGMRVRGNGPEGLVVSMPLDQNRNHQQTAFAGSLNALCTIAGWSATYVLLRALNLDGNIVIRRSSIRYHEPVTSDDVVARCQPISTEARDYFLEMLEEKGQAKLDLTVEIPGAGQQTAVTFQGSYVVTNGPEPPRTP